MFLTNTTTQKLEGFARRLGADFGIVKHEQNSAGVWFVVSVDKQPLTRWISLGWTVHEARERIESRICH